MNITEIKKTVPILLKSKVVPFLWGSQGVGKTQVMKQIAADLKLGFIHLHLATQEVGDLVGLLVHNEDGTVRHARPEWFPTEGEGIVFLDEANRAHPDVLQAMYSFITEGTIHRHKLPEGWSIVAAGNYQNESFQVTDTSDSAWLSRFCHLDFTPSVEEFTGYVEDQGLDTISSFVKNHPEMLETKPKERPVFEMLVPNRRGLCDMIGRLEQFSDLDDVRYEVYSGIIGKIAAASYLSYKKQAVKRLSGKQILKDFSKVKAEVLEISNPNNARFDLLDSAVEEIMLLLPKKPLTDKQIDNFQEFLLTIPLELGLKVINRIHKLSWPQRNVILNDKKFVERFKNVKLKERK